MHEMAWAQQRPKLRARECGYGKTLQVTFWQELLHQENAYSTTLASSQKYRDTAKSEASYRQGSV